MNITLFSYVDMKKWNTEYFVPNVSKGLFNAVSPDDHRSNMHSEIGGFMNRYYCIKRGTSRALAAAVSIDNCTML